MGRSDAPLFHRIRPSRCAPNCAPRDCSLSTLYPCAAYFLNDVATATCVPFTDCSCNPTGPLFKIGWSGKGQDFQAGTLGNRFMRLLPFFALLLLTTPQAQADLCFDLFTGGSFSGGVATYTQSYLGGTYTLQVSSADGDVQLGALGLGIDGSDGSGNDSFVDDDESISFALSWTAGSVPLNLNLVDGILILGGFQTGVDTFNSLPGTLSTPSTSFTLTPTGSDSTAAFTKIQASAVPEPSALGLCGLMVLGCFRRKRRRAVA